jgi:hypothetical protein
MSRIFAVAAFLTVLTAIASASRAAVFSYSTTLNGAAEGTPSLGTGTATVDYNDSTHMLHVHADFSGLSGTTTGSHIHSDTSSPGTGTVGIAVPFGTFPNGVTAGTFDATLDETLTATWTSTYLSAHGGTAAGAEAALFSSLNNQTAYWNIHTNLFPGGEIRGFLAPVPEPATFVLGALGAVGLLAVRARMNRVH